MKECLCHMLRWKVLKPQENSFQRFKLKVTRLLQCLGSISFSCRFGSWIRPACKKMQGGQNVRIVRILFFLTLKLYGFYGLYRFFFKLYGLYGFLAWKKTFPPFFDSFQQICMKIFKKKFVKKKLV